MVKLTIIGGPSSKICSGNRLIGARCERVAPARLDLEYVAGVLE